MYTLLKDELKNISLKFNLGQKPVYITAFPLKPEEALGNPEAHDYPLLKGKERMMQAEFMGAKGCAFSDMYGYFAGELEDILTMDIRNNFRRAILISTLNAILRYLGLVDRTVHCRDDDPIQCALELVEHIKREYANPKIALIGFQPRMAEALICNNFKLRITDMDSDNIGTEKYSVQIKDLFHIVEDIDWCDVVLVTGSTIVNNTLSEILSYNKDNKPMIFYGVTIAGASRILNLKRFCPLGR